MDSVRGIVRPLIAFLISTSICLGEESVAAGSAVGVPDWQVAANTIWVLFAAILVFWMNAGFGCVEAGFCRSKNAVNILGKNFVVFGLSTLTFWLVGFDIMYGDGNAFLGTTGCFADGADNSPLTGDAYVGEYPSLSWAAIPFQAKFFFQLAFAGTAATIVSGCVAERIHYQSFMLFVLVLVGLGYPVTGHWIWGGGWLAGLGFWDFAGSTAVHSVGGWAGLVGILILGPRSSKFPHGGGMRPIPGHSMALAFLGGLILWMGWFGFNPGSFMAANPAQLPQLVSETLYFLRFEPKSLHYILRWIILAGSLSRSFSRRICW